ncbi:MAG TPA: glycosyltransferase family 4 protein [Gemmatimonadaceae bacterium]|nr:glycosyltransferase family 4 protein [Gemmatimonadaceae bacterium]
MRRVAIVTDWFAPRQGGIETQLAELARRLAGAGADVGVITATPGPTMGDGYDVHRLDVLTLPAPPLAISPMLIPRLREALSRGWDLVHAHVSVVSPVGWTGALVARSLGLPVAVTFHSVLRGKAVLLRLASALTPLATSRVAWSAVSRLVAEQARWGIGAGAEVNALPNGLDLSFWNVPRLGVASRVTLVSAMRLHRKKRGRQLLRAYATAARRVKVPVRMVIVGDGPEREGLLGEITMLGLRSGTATAEIRGWLRAAELRQLYAESHGFVMASVHEAFGIAALEARAAGLPVIARRSGNTEFLEHDVNALLANDDAGLAEAIASFIEDPALRSRLASGASDLSRFDWPAVIDAHLREYERAIRISATPAPAVAASA